MKKFKSKVLFIDQAVIDKSMSVLAVHCSNLNDLTHEFQETMGNAPDLKTIKHLLSAETKELYRFLERCSPNNSSETVSVSSFPPSESLNEFLKECYLKFRSKGESLEVAGVKMNFKKMLGLVDFPEFGMLISIIRKAIISNYFVFGGNLRNFVKADLSNIQENESFSSELLRNEIEAYYTTQSKTEEDNELFDILNIINENLNKLPKLGYELYANESRHDGVFRGIDFFIDRNNQGFIVSRRLLERKNIKKR